MLKTRKSGDTLVVYLEGRMEVHLSAGIEKDINALLASEKQKILVLNLAGVEYMSSSGLRILVATMRALKKEDKEMRLCNLTPSVRKVFEVVELIDMFNVFPTEAEAVRG